MRRFWRKYKASQPRGFTLIEIVLVLAIAGLLLMIVFVAVSGAQKSRRDFQRKNYAARVAASLETYFATKKSLPDPSHPATVAEFEGGFLPVEVDPLTGLVYSAANGNFQYRGIAAAHGDIPPPGTIYVEYGHWCNRYGNGGTRADPIAGNDVKTSAYVVWIGLETGHDFCVDNYNP